MNSEFKAKLINKFQSLASLEQLFVTTSGIFIFLILLNLITGNWVAPRVRDFSWKNQQIGAKDKSFMLTFNRPVEHSSVEANLKIEPLLPGKISWMGNKMAYTLTQPPLYENSYEIQLKGAKSKQDLETEVNSFQTEFPTRDRAFAYIGVEAEEQGRLILYNLTQQKKTVLTPGELVIVDFESYPNGEKILFSALNKNDKTQDLGSQKLYTVTTGINFADPEKAQPSGKIKEILDSENYYNLEFDLAADGKNIVVRRVNQKNATDFGLWLIGESGKPESLGIQGGKIKIAPDGKTVAVTQTEKVAIASLNPEPPPDTATSGKIFSGYDQILAYDQTINQTILVKNNPDYTASLFILNQQGEAQKILTTARTIIECELEPKKEKTLYCLTSQTRANQPEALTFITAINLETAEIIDLLALPSQGEAQINISPDGIGLLFDRLAPATEVDNETLTTEDGIAIATGRLWLLPLPETLNNENLQNLAPQELVPGFHPHWLP
ncbi:MAG: hypothetical protein SAJ37_22125 [Oscillatoria sp. PMC 1068.18]|nr:hypothetical protein [Oscillatoria sp. PMC 1076.18]MEC4991441.1 hypothetical protein [Oscillatoria sp. PMC 1068.18]